MENNTTKKIIDFIKTSQGVSSNDVYKSIVELGSISTVKRELSKLIKEQLIITKGEGKSTKYFISPLFELLYTIHIDTYYKKEIDERIIKKDFNFDLIKVTLSQNSIFYPKELEKLQQLQDKHKQNILGLSPELYNKEMERLAIDLSWKSSQIEGNTYSLLETEQLLKEKQTAIGKTKEEAIMLLNHKDALDFVIANPDYLIPLSIRNIEDIHSLLMKDLGVHRNLRKRRVGITGTNYTPLDNEFQIKEALSLMCDLVNAKENVFEKCLLTLLLLSYIQPFEDGNKRTARIVSNAILINYKYCPLSFRTVNATDYKKAMLLFYEQNNVSAFKELFINQCEFAVRNYF